MSGPMTSTSWTHSYSKQSLKPCDVTKSSMLLSGFHNEQTTCSSPSYSVADVAVLEMQKTYLYACKIILPAITIYLH